MHAQALEQVAQVAPDVPESPQVVAGAGMAVPEGRSSGTAQATSVLISSLGGPMIGERPQAPNESIMFTCNLCGVGMTSKRRLFCV